MVRHNHQYGGTKMSMRQNKGARNESWVPITNYNDISLMILQNLCSLKVVSSSSLCSMVLVGMLHLDSDIRKRSQIYQEDGTPFPTIKRANRPKFTNEGKIEPYVCLKISLIVPHGQTKKPRLSWEQTPGDIKAKETTTLDEIRNEVASQRAAALAMLCGENASDVIPDILSECLMTPDNFTKTSNIIYSNNASYAATPANGTQEIDTETRRVVSWLDFHANNENLYVHITFMDYIEGYMTVKEFFKSHATQAIQFEVSCQALAVILILLLKGRIMSWDFHAGNLLTNGKSAKGVDLGRKYTLGLSNDDPIKKDRHQIKNFAFANIFKLNKIFISVDIQEAFKHFFNLKKLVPDSSSKNLERFSDDFKRLLVDLPENAYYFSTWSPEQKRKNVYEAIMMLAFIDGITNACLYKVKGIQCSTVLKCAFGIRTYFDTIDNFLVYFRLDYDVFLQERAAWPEVIDQVNTALDRICEILEPQLLQCQVPRRQTPADFDFHDDSEAEAEAEAEPEPDLGSLKRRSDDHTNILTKKSEVAGNGAEVVAEVGGSKRRPRRNSNKKRKYKSRKRIRSRRKHYMR